MVYVLTYLRAILGSAVLIPFTAIYSIICVGFALLGCQNICSAMIYQWASLVLWTYGIRSEIKGEERLPESGGGIIVFNHQSLFDIPVLMTATRKHTIRFGAKIELFRIPFFGHAMRAVGTLPIARENRAAVMQVYKEAEDRCKSGTLFCLAPEGTRQEEPRIGRFKKGPFIFAMNAGVPLVPAVIKGAHDVLPKRSLKINVGQWSRTIKLEFLPPVPTQGIPPEDLDKLIDRVRTMMVEAYKTGE